VELASKSVSEIKTISATWTTPNSETGAAYYGSGIQPMKLKKSFLTPPKNLEQKILS